LLKIKLEMRVTLKKMSVEEYLTFEDTSDVRHEYFDGKLHTMPGTTDFHNEICLQIAFLLRNLLKSKGYKVYMENVKVRITDSKYTYPDVFVTGDSRDSESRRIKQYPVMIIEVLSDKTRVYDKTDKFILYQKIASLKYYLTVEPEKPLVECYSLQEDGTWEVETFTSLSEKITFTSLNIDLEMADIYEK
jgi:Uma2 family endonuclease